MALRIVFMGTPDFAVPSLAILVENGYQVVGVITATDKYGGRGKKKLLESAVKKYAVEHQIPVLQPTKLKDEQFLKALSDLQADVQIVVAFRMLPEVVWSMPKYGTYNLHGSLLPKYRGAAPINWAIIKGEKTTGVTSFKIQHQIDTGDLLFQEKMTIEDHDTAGTVHDRMMVLGAQVVLKTVQAIESGTVELQQQAHQAATHAPKIFHATCEIDFNLPTAQVHDFIRGLSPYPAAWTIIKGQQLKLFRTLKTTVQNELLPGHFEVNGQQLFVGTADGALEILALQIQGRRKMTTKDFLNGYRSFFEPQAV